MSVAGNASLKIFDITGKEVATLVNEKLNAGTYTVNWNGTRFASGVYFYRLTAEGYGETRKMMLIR
ncbi:MAG: T9SS type A sorting domain-containing protein [Ignavibacteriae bacterium]|nr:T9SS type A sorting domain-containing protein [Ignavibacteriota bacterium]